MFFGIATQHIQAGTALATPFPIEAVLLSVSLELLKEVERLKERVEILERTYESVAR